MEASEAAASGLAAPRGDGNYFLM